MKFETKYNIGDEVILSGVQCETIRGIMVYQEKIKTTQYSLPAHKKTGKIIVGYQSDQTGKIFTDEDVICLKSEFLDVFGKKKENPAS